MIHALLALVGVVVIDKSENETQRTVGGVFLAVGLSSALNKLLKE